MTLHDLQIRRKAMGPTLHWAADLNCRADGRHEVSADPVQLPRLPIVVDGAVLGSRYCYKCCAVFGPDGLPLHSMAS